jgi:hypothetical protein
MKPTKKQNVHIVIGKKGTLRTFLKKYSGRDSPNKDHYRWVYLGTDICLSTQIGELIGTAAERLIIGDDLQECAGRYRQDYVDFVGKLSEKTNSPLWFFTSLSEKNPFLSNFFLYFCYVKLCLKYITENRYNLVIVCEDREILDLLRANLQNSPSCTVTFHDSPADVYLYPFISLVHKIKNKCIFLIRFLLRAACAKIFSFAMRSKRQNMQEDSAILIHSWTDLRSFPKKSVYNETYLGRIGDFLEQRGCTVIYLSDVLPTLWYPKALCRLLKADKKIFLMEEFLSFRDIISCLFFVSKNYPDAPQDAIFLGIDVTSLIVHEYTRDKASFRTEQCYLNFFISQRILRSVTLNSFLFTFENHIWEKAFCEGLKKNRMIKTIGYSIVFINRMYTCYSHSMYEKETSPVPDIILVSGSQGKEKLTEFGFKPDRIAIGGAVRYPSLQISGKPLRVTGEKNILVALSGSLNASLELTYVSIRSFAELKKVNILIKCHPTVPFQHISPYLPDLPEHFTIVEKTIPELLDISDIVVYTESTVSVEAAARGIPLIHIKSDISIDINIFDGMTSVPSSSNPKIIRETAQEILENKQKSELLSKDIIKDLFAPVDTDLIAKKILD